VSVDETARWNAQAERYDSSYDDPRAGRLVRARVDVAVGLAGDGPGSALDAGMGGGRLLEALAARGWSVTGSDVSEAMVELARRRVPQATLVVAPVEQLPFADASFDAAAALGVLEFAHSVDAALRELGRVLRPGGLAVVSWPNFGGLYTAWRGGILYRVARAAGRPAPPPARHVLRAGEFRRRLRAALLEPETEILLSAAGASLRPAMAALAAQRVFAARRRG
jgi:2-polyprenyl-6-hydroxyphenyl methylase/3-demethylubiquinone-9 3-methyltransferase